MTNMLYGTVPGIDKPVSRIVQGIIQVQKDDEAKGFAFLDALYEAGVNCIDTARIYGNSDAFLGKWVRTRKLQDKVVLLAKGAHHNNLRRRVTAYDIGTDLHDTLAAMELNYVDLYVLHRDDPNYPVEPIVDALNQFKNEGKIGAFGGSNWTTQRLQAANEYALRTGQTPFAVSSPNFSMAEQVQEPWDNCVSISGSAGEEQRKWYAEHKMPLFTWSSLAGGFWSGRFTRENYKEHSGYHEELVQKCYCYPQNFERMDRAKQLAQKYDLSLPQIALSYVMSYPLDIYALVGSASMPELHTNIQALHHKLTPAEIEWLELRTNTQP